MSRTRHYGWLKLSLAYHLASHLLAGAVASQGPSQDSPQFDQRSNAAILSNPCGAALLFSERKDWPISLRTPNISAIITQLTDLSAEDVVAGWEIPRFLVVPRRQLECLSANASASNAVFDPLHEAIYYFAIAHWPSSQVPA